MFFCWWGFRKNVYFCGLKRAWQEMQLFYIDSLESEMCTLSEEESIHCVRVLRKAAGDAVEVTDGRGTLAQCRIVEAHPKHCLLQVEARTEAYGRRPYGLHLAVAPTKNAARMEWLLEKAVEMGVESFTPLVCAHSERTALKQERMAKIAVSAMKQSLKAYLPALHAPTTVEELIAQPFAGQRFIAYCVGAHRTPLREAYTAGSDALILIGPEGDFSADEVAMALAAGFVPVTLGASRLRTETAALAALAFFNLMNG